MNSTNSEPLNRVKRFWYMVSSYEILFHIQSISIDFQLNFFKSSPTVKSCITPSNRTGLCKPIHHCFMNNLWENISQFTSTFCGMDSW